MKKILTLLVVSILVLEPAAFVMSQSSSDDLLVAKDALDVKKSQLDQVNKKIEEYRSQISKQERLAESLNDDLLLLDNRVAKTNLDIEANKLELEVTNREISIFDKQIKDQQQKLLRNRETLSEVLEKIQVYDNKSELELYFGHDSFSEFFNELIFLENMNDSLVETIQETEHLRQQLASKKELKKEKQDSLAQLSDRLEVSLLRLDEEQNAKGLLLTETHETEAQYQQLLRELKQERQFIDQKIYNLQRQIEQKLIDLGDLGDSTTLSWPANPSRGISATFHDPTYPFRHLFEHSGTDIPLVQGTALTAAAPGYVAVAKQGRGYGNYVMIIHANGIATLYAHMSSIGVVPDQFVSRGEVIGYSGGTPGTAGAGFSTGAHLHFEVRKDGIPVNPMNYLISL